MKKKGFTIIELIISMFIYSLIIGVIGSVFSSASKLLDSNKTKINNTLSIIDFYNEFNKDYLSIITDKIDYEYDSEEKNIKFITNNRNENIFPAFLVDYNLETLPDKLVLYKKVSAFIDNKLNLKNDNVIELYKIKLLELKNIKFSFYYSKMKKEKLINNKKPEMLKMEIETLNNDKLEYSFL